MSSVDDPWGGRRARQLPSGRHGLPRQFVVHNQRERILAAVAECCSRVGYAPMSVQSIITAAGVSRRTFYQQFKNKEDVFLAAYDAAAEQLIARVREAVEREEDGVDRIRAGLAAFLEFLAGEPAFARMCLVDVLAAGPEAVARRNAAMAAFATLFVEYSPANERLPLASSVIAESVVGGIYEVVASRTMRNETASLPELLPELMYAATVPYIGQHAAAEEYRRLRPAEPAQG